MGDKPQTAHSGRTTLTSKLKPGTFVETKPSFGYLQNYRVAEVISHANGAVRLRTVGSDDTCVARHEVRVVRDQKSANLVSLRRRLPYGEWTCTDGRKVLFNRNYKPIWQRLPGHCAERADPEEKVKFVEQKWFYEDDNTPWRDAKSKQRCELVLAEFVNRETRRHGRKV